MSQAEREAPLLTDTIREVNIECKDRGVDPFRKLAVLYVSLNQSNGKKFDLLYNAISSLNVCSLS